MKILFFIAAIFISIVASGQDTLNQQVTNKNFKRILISVNVSPDYCYRTVKDNEGSEFSSVIIAAENNNEVPKFGYSGGLNIFYGYRKNIGFELGLQYSTKGFAYRNIGLVFGDMINPRNGYGSSQSFGVSPLQARFIYNYNYIDIPVRAIYHFGKNKIHFVTSVGVTTNILLNATQTVIVEDANGSSYTGTQNQDYKFKSINISPTFSIGVNYKINEKLNLQAEPTFRYGLINILDAPISTYLWNAGLNISCYYKLK